MVLHHWLHVMGYDWACIYETAKKEILDPSFLTHIDGLFLWNDSFMQQNSCNSYTFDKYRQAQLNHVFFLFCLSKKRRYRTQIIQSFIRKQQRNPDKTKPRELSSSVAFCQTSNVMWNQFISQLHLHSQPQWKAPALGWYGHRAENSSWDTQILSEMTVCCMFPQGEDVQNGLLQTTVMLQRSLNIWWEYRKCRWCSDSQSHNQNKQHSLNCYWREPTYLSFKVGSTMFECVYVWQVHFTGKNLWSSSGENKIPALCLSSCPVVLVKILRLDDEGSKYNHSSQQDRDSNSYSNIICQTTKTNKTLNRYQWQEALL